MDELYISGWTVTLTLYLFYYFNGLPLFGILIFFLFKNAPTPLYLSRDKIKGQSGKNISLTSTKIFPKK